MAVKGDGIIPNCSCGMLLTHKQTPQKCNVVSTLKSGVVWDAPQSQMPPFSRGKGSVVGGWLECELELAMINSENT